MTRREKKRGLTPVIALVIVLAVAAACGLGGWAFVSSAKKSFSAKEATMPDSAISTYLKHISSKDYSGIYEDSLIVDPSLNSKDDYIAKIEEIYQGVDTDKVTYAPVADATDTEYNLYNGDTYLATLKLVQSDAGKWLASTLFKGKNSYVVEVPTGLSIQANGLTVDDSYKTAVNVTASNYSGLDDQDSAPKVDQYTLNNLLSQPQITVVGQSGYGTLKDVLSNTIFVGKTADSSDLANVFMDDAQIVAQFPAQESSLSSVAAISVTGSDWYSRVSTMQNTWFTSHSTSSFSNVKASNIIQQSDDTMVGYVTFDYYASNGTVSRTWNGGYQISFLKVNGTWKIAGFGVDTTLNPATAK